MLRLRQIAFAATDLDAAERSLASTLTVERCFRDPGVAVFGLRNALYPVGDQFLEIVSPVEPDTTAGRLLARRGGDCGYMVLFQTDALAPIEQRIAASGIRIVFDAQGAGIRGIHLHPKDVPGAIVSVDAADDPAEWPWAGPAWRDHVDTRAVEAIAGLDVAVADPAAACETWGRVLGITPSGTVLTTDDGPVRFVEADPRSHRDGIVAIDVTTPDAALAGTRHDLLGVTVRFVAR